MKNTKQNIEMVKSEHDNVTNATTNVYEPVTLENINKQAIKCVNAKLKFLELRSSDPKIHELRNQYTKSFARLSENLAKAECEYLSNPNAKTLKTLHDVQAAFASTPSCNDYDDLIQECKSAMLLAVDDSTLDPFNEGLKAVNNYINAERKRTTNTLYYEEYSIETDADGNENVTVDIVDANDVLAQLIKQIDNNDTLCEISRLLTKTQLRIFHLVAKGYTYETIATRVQLKTADAVRKQIYRARKKLADNGYTYANVRVIE